MHSVLVSGAYGFFGRRICQALAAEPRIRLLVAGRDPGKAQALAAALGLPAAQALALDARAATLAQQFTQAGVHTVIHTAGPFQGQDYAVARAAMAAGAHYIDLADGRDFVAGIAQLDAAARARGVLVCSGASSLPALSSAVVDHLLPRFGRLDAIAHGISSGARSPGLATLRGIFGYGGKPFERWVDGRWQSTFGWLDLQAYRFPPPVGLRLLGSCDVPDVALFAARYPGVKSVRFHAGFASAPGHLVVWLLAQLVRLGLLRSMAGFAPALHALSEVLQPLVSDKGGMYVSLRGEDPAGAPLQLVWHLVATHNHGPQIPCGAAIALARKLACGGPLEPGARPCMGLLTLHEYLAELASFDVWEIAP